jgi:voltage-gated potassium channel
MSLLRAHPPVLLGEGVELVSVYVPAALTGCPLRDLGIGSRTGLSVVAVQGAQELTPLPSDTLLPDGAELPMLGSDEQRAAFSGAFGKG